MLLNKDFIFDICVLEWIIEFIWKKKMGVGRFFIYFEKLLLFLSDNLYLFKRIKVGYKYFLV